MGNFEQNWDDEVQAGPLVLKTPADAENSNSGASISS